MVKLLCNQSLVPKCWPSEKDKPIWCFNPSLIRWKDHWLFVYRIILNDQKRRIGLCRLNDDFEIIGNSVMPLSDFIVFSPELNYSDHVKNWFADPRLFWLGDTLFLYFNSGWHDPYNHQFLIAMDPDTGKPISYAREIIVKSERQKIEKNWMFFGQDPFYAIYSVSPHCILKVNLNDPHYVLCEEISRKDIQYTDYLLRTALRGGAPPYYKDGEYYSFCHTLHPSQHGARYEASVYRFSSHFPFYPTQLPNKKLMLPNPKGLTRDFPQLNPAVTEVIYPCGAIFHDEKWIVSYGINDERCAIAAISQQIVNECYE